MKNVKKARTALLSTLCVLLMAVASMPLAYAQEDLPIYVIYLMVAYDEEWRSVAQSYYFYSPEELAQVILCDTFYHFWSESGIDFWVVTYCEWDSDDSVELYRGLENGH